MKFSFAILSLALASVQGASLRAPANNNNGQVLDSEVILKGTVGEPTAEDMEFIGKALVASYNNVHWEVGHYMTGSHAVDFKGPDSFLCRHCPDDDSMGGSASATGVFEVKTPVGFLCRHCPDDDAMGTDSLLMTAVTEDCAGLCKKDAAAELEAFLCRHCPDDDAMGSNFDIESLNSDAFDKKAVEVAFCKKIQNSVSKKLAATKTCSIAVESVIAANSNSKAW
eukprot:jgi/Psemu1/284534/fgenesh1_pg.56_\